eukprot:gene3452-2403_t
MHYYHSQTTLNTALKSTPVGIHNKPTTPYITNHNTEYTNLKRAMQPKGKVKYGLNPQIKSSNEIYARQQFPNTSNNFKVPNTNTLGHINRNTQRVRHLNDLTPASNTQIELTLQASKLQISKQPKQAQSVKLTHHTISFEKFIKQNHNLSISQYKPIQYLQYNSNQITHNQTNHATPNHNHNQYTMVHNTTKNRKESHPQHSCVTMLFNTLNTGAESIVYNHKLTANPHTTLIPNKSVQSNTLTHANTLNVPQKLKTKSYPGSTQNHHISKIRITQTHYLPNSTYAKHENDNYNSTLPTILHNKSTIATLNPHPTNLLYYIKYPREQSYNSIQINTYRIHTQTKITYLVCQKTTSFSKYKPSHNNQNMEYLRPHNSSSNRLAYYTNFNTINQHNIHATHKPHKLTPSQLPSLLQHKSTNPHYICEQLPRILETTTLHNCSIRTKVKSTAYPKCKSNNTNHSRTHKPKQAITQPINKLQEIISSPESKQVNYQTLQLNGKLQITNYNTGTTYSATQPENIVNTKTAFIKTYVQASRTHLTNKFKSEAKPVTRYQQALGSLTRKHQPQQLLNYYHQQPQRNYIIRKQKYHTTNKYTIKPPTYTRITTKSQQTNSTHHKTLQQVTYKHKQPTTTTRQSGSKSLALYTYCNTQNHALKPTHTHEVVQSYSALNYKNRKTQPTTNSQTRTIFVLKHHQSTVSYYHLQNLVSASTFLSTQKMHSHAQLPRIIVKSPHSKLCWQHNNQNTRKHLNPSQPQPLACTQLHSELTTQSCNVLIKQHIPKTTHYRRNNQLSNQTNKSLLHAFQAASKIYLPTPLQQQQLPELAKTLKPSKGHLRTPANITQSSRNAQHHQLDITSAITTNQKTTDLDAHTIKSPPNTNPQRINYPNTIHKTNNTLGTLKWTHKHSMYHKPLIKLPHHKLNLQNTTPLHHLNNILPNTMRLQIKPPKRTLHASNLNLLSIRNNSQQNRPTTMTTNTHNNNYAYTNYNKSVSDQSNLFQAPTPNHQNYQFPNRRTTLTKRKHYNAHMHTHPYQPSAHKAIIPAAITCQPAFLACKQYNQHKHTVSVHSTCQNPTILCQVIYLTYNLEATQSGRLIHSQLTPTSAKANRTQHLKQSTSQGNLTPVNPSHQQSNICSTPQSQTPTTQTQVAVQPAHHSKTQSVATITHPKVCVLQVHPNSAR